MSPAFPSTTPYHETPNLWAEVIDLNQVLQDLYDQALLDLVIDYGQPPVPPVTDVDLQWIQSFLSA
jgi:hypothetical protein